MTDPRLARYRRLPYQKTVERVTDEDGTYYVCSYPELPGLKADGDTPGDAEFNADAAFDDYILAHLHFDDAIPEPEGAKRMQRIMAQSDLLTSGPLVLINMDLILAESAQILLRSLPKEGFLRNTISHDRKAVLRAESSLIPAA